MDGKVFMETATKAVKDFYKEEVEVVPVWFGYILGNMKGLFIALNGDNYYYEATLNKAKAEIYIDRYVKGEQKIIHVNPEEL